MQNDADARTDPRWTRTRQAILRAGGELFGKFGLEGINVDDLTEAAGISKQSFYNHFDSKSELAFEIMRLARRDLEAKISIANADETDPARRIARGVCAYARNAWDEPGRSYLIGRLLIDAEHPLHEGVSSDVELALSSGRLGMFKFETGVTFIAGVTQALVSQIVDYKELSGVVALAQQFVTLLLRAFGLPPPEAELIATQAAERIVRQGLPVKKAAIVD
jgi:AcrR family transcriptional regulator